MSPGIPHRTLVLGASPDPSRYSYLATLRLTEAGHPVIPVGRRPGTIGGLPIQTGKPELKDIDTVTLYLNPEHQREWYDYLIRLGPRRIIFNPGTENPDFERIAHDSDIQTENACTLVLISTGQY